MTVKGISGGTPNDRGMVLGEYANTSGSFTMSGGVLTVDNAMWLGQNGAGSWSISGGDASVKRLAFANAAAASGILNLTGGTLAIGSGGITKGSGTATLNMGGGILASSASWSTTVAIALTGTNGNLSVSTDHSVTLGGALSGAGGLTKKGSGTLSLTTANSYAGSTLIQQGTLSLGAAGTVGNLVALGTSSGGTGTLDVSAKASFTQANLSGNGIVNIGAGKTVGITTTLSPGFSIGTLSITGNLALGGSTKAAAC